MMRLNVLRAGVVVGALLVGACESARAPRLPDEDQVREIYTRYQDLDSVDLSGNVVELRFRQDPQALRRGGSLWAKVGPYVFLLSPATRELFTRFPDIAAVRVVTLGTGSEEVARAMLRQDAFTDIQWRRTQNILGHAIREGSRSPSRLEDLVQWGERHTEFSYNPDYVPQ
ncbi:MAG TPA: hypothetical protein VMK65_10560 [Longimicrobiales bacterium]|nr:hypothetical protein [Longimicrobiales bacterium]